MHDRYSKLFRYLQLALDLLVLNAIFLLAGALRFDDLRVENEEYYNYYVQLLVFMNLAWVLVAVMLNSYVFYPALEIRRSLGKVFNTILIHAAVLALLLVSLKGYYYSRLFFTYFYIGFVPGVLLARIFIMNRFRAFLRKESNARPIVLLGSSPEADAFAKMLADHPEYGLRIAAWFGQHNGQLPVEQATEWLATNKAVELFCALDGNDPDIGRWLKLADANLIRFRYLPALGIKNITNASVELMGDVPVLIPRKEPLEYRHNRLLKRSFDLLFSLLVILIIYPITFPLIAIAIKLSSKGPVFFTQQRSGLNNAVFNVLKFRTMTVNPQADTRQATKGDERITSIGHFLRKHNLDELPQFLNVLAGHMSVVGPRPHMLNHTAAYRKLIDAFMVRHLIKPGITGLAQTRGLRGETGDPGQMRDRVKADVYYLENWSLLLDLKIVLETIWNMVRGKSKGV
jgi:putative colanic acid biosynthesis UDP-glucose lipid carrier transferase